LSLLVLLNNVGGIKYVILDPFTYTLYDDNPVKHSKKDVKLITESILSNKYGQILPLKS
jgi:hypothetical protein